MKCLITFLLTLILPSIVFSQVNLEEAKKLGLVSYLTYINHNSEIFLANQQQLYTPEASLLVLLKPSPKIDSISITNNNAKYMQEIYKRYNEVKMNTDILINQLSADMIYRNSLKNYRKLNTYLTNNINDTGITRFHDVVEHINRSYNRLIESKPDGNAHNNFTGAEILTAVGLIYTAFKDNRDTKGTRTNVLIKFLAELKLKNIGDIIKPKEKNKE